MKIITMIKNHKWAVILAVLAGLIIAFPQLYFRSDDSYQGVDMPLTGAEHFYWGRIQEVRDGHTSLGNVWFAEYKDRPYIQPPLGEIITALPGKVFGLGISDTIVLSRIIFPSLIFLSVYGFVYLLIKKKYVALIAPLGLLLADNVFSRPFILNLLKGDIVPYQSLGYARPVIPQISSLLFFSSLLFLWLFLTRERKIFGIISGILLGTSFYVFFYTWSLIYAFMGILGLIFLFKKNWIDLKKIFLVAAVSLLVAIPYGLNTLQSMQYPEYFEATKRMGLIESHKPTQALLIPAVLLVFLIIFPRAWKKRYLFCLALLASPLIALNQQIVTGKVLINDHYHWYYSKPLALIFMAIIFLYLLEKAVSSGFLKKLAIGAIISAFILNGITTSFIDYFYTLGEDYDSIVYRQKYGPVLGWLDKNAKKDEVVLANGNFSVLIPIYTSLNAYDSKWVNQYLVPRQELVERMFLKYRLQGVRPDDASEIFLAGERYFVSWKIFGEYYRQKFGEWENAPDEAFYPLVEDYRALYNIPIQTLFQRFNIKYAVWDMEKEPEWALDKYPFLKELHRENKVIIYLFNLGS